MKNIGKCLVCEIELIGLQKKYCSLKCRSKDYYSKYYTHFEWQSERECQKCSKKFSPQTKNKKFCSENCRKSSWKKKHSNSFWWKKERNCNWCDIKFIPKHNVQNCCSETCANYSYRKVNGAKNPGFRGTKIACRQCLAKFPAHNSSCKFCSKKCRARWERLNKKEMTRNRDRIHLSNRRSLKRLVNGSFTAKQWEELKQVYGNKCKDCLRKEPEISLTVDHKVPLSKWQEWAKVHNPTYGGNDIENIQPLCKSCNSRKNSNL
jgi:hypothetical protein